MAKERKRYPLIGKAFKATKQRYPDLTPTQAYYLGASLIVATVDTTITKHPELRDVLLPQILESLVLELNTLIEKEAVHDTLIA